MNSPKGAIEWRIYATYLLPWWLLIPIISISLYLHQANTIHLQATLQANLLIESAVDTTLISNISNLRNDIALFQHMAASRPGNSQLDELGNFFTEFLSAQSHYLQARILDDRCKEILRVERRNDQVVRIDDAELQDKSRRYYCTRTLKLGPDRFFLSPLDLNVELGEVQQPLTPVLRISASIADPSGRTIGMVILNYNAGQILNDFKQVTANKVALLNEDGYWLASDNPDSEFGFQLQQPQRTFANTYPQVWARIQAHLSNPSQSTYYDDDWAVRRVNALQKNAGDIAPTWYAVAPLFNAAHSAQIHASTIRFALGSVIILLSLTFLSIKLASSDIRRARMADALATSNQKLQASLTDLENSLEERVQSEKLASLGLLVSGVAHELNTPLGGALLLGKNLSDNHNTLQAAYSEGLRESDLQKFMDSNAHGLALLMKNLERAAQLITQFKNVAGDRAAGKCESFNLSELIHDIVSLIQLQAKRADITIQINVPADITLTSYAGPLGQIIQNLVFNAIKHGFQDTRSGQIDINAHCEEDLLILDIIDNGMGIPEAIRTAIWDPFFTTNRKTGGTGLGLHLCRQIAENMLGGSLLLLDPPLNGGVCMQLRIPLTAPVHDEPTAPAKDDAH